MKKKRVSGLLAAFSLLVMMFSGCNASNVVEEAGPTAAVQITEPETPGASIQQKEINISAYPVDMRFSEWTKINISMEPNIQLEPTKETQPEESTLNPEGESPSKMLSDTLEEGADELCQETESQHDLPNKVPDNNVSEIVVHVFRREIQMQESEDLLYRIQVHIEDSSSLIMEGNLRPDGIQWEGAAASENTVCEKIGQALLDGVQWKASGQNNTYAHDLRMTQCMISGRNVLYTNAECTVFKIQTYDENENLSTVLELSQNSAKLWVNGVEEQIPWNADCYPELEFSVQELIVGENTDISEIQKIIDEYWGQILNLRQVNEQKHMMVIVLGTIAMLVVLVNLIILICFLCKRGSKWKKEAENSSESVGMVKGVGIVHNIGGRSGQQDSYDVINCSAGTLAVVADGMGGLSDGDKVSQLIVATMRGDSARIRAGNTEGVLCQMVAHANQEVNRMLGTARQYKCGSTLISVLIEHSTMQWIAVGDSRIYLYRDGGLLQLNREHIYSAELMVRAINGKIPFAEASRNVQADRLNSFIGMGELKYVDFSQSRIRLRKGDRILLMSDGVFNTLSEHEIARVIRNSPDASAAANELERNVLEKRAPNQDNFTCVILET